ncbi:MAG: PAS domain S-box protein [Spirochaetes bacterium]|nr:PAS domain S-box protein [Spirochaetota bacterium]
MKRRSSGGAVRENPGNTPVAVSDQITRSSPGLFQSMFSLNPAASAVTTIDEGVVLNVNRALLDLTGYHENEIIGRKTGELDLWADPAQREEMIRHIREQDSINHFETKLRRKSGEIRNCLFSGNIITVDGTSCLLSIVIDITDRKRVEEQIRRSREEYRESVDNSPAGIFKYSYPGGLTFVNAAMAEIFGYDSPEEMIRKVTDVEHHIYYDPAEGMSTFRLLKNYGGFRNMEYRCRKRDGSPFWVMASCRAMADETGRISVVDGYFTDITKRKEAEEALARELAVNRSLGGVYEKILGVSLSMDELCDIVLASAAELTESVIVLVSQTDASPGELARVHRARGIDGTAAPEFLDAFRRLIANDDGSVRECMVENDAPPAAILGATGPTLMRYLAVPAMMRGDLLGLIVAANAERDYSISDRESMKRLAAVFAIAINRIRNEEQIDISMRENNLLLKEIHHRVKNNMQIISSLLGLQAGHVKDEGDAALFKVSQDRVRSMALVHEKLYRSDTLAGLDFREYVTDLVRQLSDSYSIEGRINIRVNAERVFVSIDNAIPCSLVIYELVSNALKHAFPGEAGGRIDIDFSRCGDSYVLRVCDDGTGLPEGLDFLDTATLGLQLVNALVQQLRGSIRLEDVPGTSYLISFRGQE